MIRPAARPVSIRSRLARSVAVLAVAWTVAALALTWWSVASEVDELLDDTSRASAPVLGGLLALQANLSDPAPSPLLAGDGEFAWQLVDAGGRVLQRSARAPTRPFVARGTLGFIDAGAWRVYGVDASSQRVAEELTRRERIALICGRYEGVDERVREHLVTDEISIGDYVLTGGELPALTIIDAVTRLLPGALGDPTGAEDDSHSMGLLEYPHYTKPAEFRGWKVPEVLTSGDHGKIDKWRREQALARTHASRPELLETAELSEKDRKFLATLKHG